MTSYAVKEPLTEPRRSVDDCLQLDISDLTISHPFYFRRWHGRGGLQWVDDDTGDRNAYIDYEVNTENLNNEWIRLSYTVTDENDEKKHIDYQIALDTPPPTSAGSAGGSDAPEKAAVDGSGDCIYHQARNISSVGFVMS